jgi:hypothetical protein
MKKLWIVLTAVALSACNEMEELNSCSDYVVTGYNETDVDSRTAFGNPKASTIPFLWSAGDYIWLGATKSEAISSECQIAQFKFQDSPATVGTGHVFYNLTAEHKNAHVLSTQTADGNLGNDGDFGYATLDEYGAFCLKHKTSYLWFDTTTKDAGMPKLTSITVDANGVNIAGKQTYDFQNDKWGASITEGSSTITLNFAGGHALVAENSGVMAAMVCLPAKVSGKTLTVTYNFADGSKFTETKNPTKDLVSGATSRIKTQIEKKNLVKEPSYELRVLTFEDKDAKFSPYELDYVGANITTWSDLIDEPQYSGLLTYGNDATDAMYYWYDEGNTELYHMFPDNYGYYCFWGGGHAISNYWGAGYADEDRNNHIANYYGKDYVDQWAGKPGADAALGWFLLQLMAPIAPHSGDNFVVHYGYKDFFSYVENLPEISFFDGEPRVIDHMYVTNTNYTLNQLYNGVKSEEGNSFGGDWTGLTEDAWLKIVAYGYDDPDADEPTSEAEFYLVNGLNVVETWQKWDLSVLGKVAKVRFNFLYSDAMGGSYGFTIPGYFAYDDIAVRFEK